MNTRSFGHTQSMFRRVPTLLGLLALAALLAVLLSASSAQAELSGYLKVSAGDLHTCALRLDGTVNCWGANGYGQAKDPGDVYFTDVSAGGSHTCGILQSSGGIHCWGYNFSGQAPNLREGVYTQVSAGTNHTCALTPDGTIECWGNNSKGQAENSPAGIKYKQVSAGENHTCGLTVGGNVDCWGDPLELSSQDRVGDFDDVSAGGSHNCAVSAVDGHIECWGQDGYRQSDPPSGAFTNVSAGNLHTCAIDEGGALACWGYNHYGQLDVPTITEPFFQVDSGGGHSCAVSQTGEVSGVPFGDVYCWGRNDHGQASVGMPSNPGLGYAFTGFFPPVRPVPTLNPVKAGSAVPLKFSLGADKGLNILLSGSPASIEIDCTLLQPTGELQSAASAGGAGLTYDPASGQYTYVWKTEKAWAGTCRALALQLDDNSVHLAGFRFK